MNENRKTQPQLWKQFQWLGMLVLAVCLLWCNAARVKAEDIVIQCGDNCYGTLTEDGTLTISGTGPKILFIKVSFINTEKIFSKLSSGMELPELVEWLLELRLKDMSIFEA